MDYVVMGYDIFFLTSFRANTLSWIACSSALVASIYNVVYEFESFVVEVGGMGEGRERGVRMLLDCFIGTLVAYLFSLLSSSSLLNHERESSVCNQCRTGDNDIKAIKSLLWYARLCYLLCARLSLLSACFSEPGLTPR
jgi:hypothetical protein